MTNQEIRESLELLENGETLPVEVQTRALKDLLRANKKLIAIRKEAAAQTATAKPTPQAMPFRRGA